MNNNMNMNMLLNMLSKMDKKDLEKGLEQANKILNSKNKDEIINRLKKYNPLMIDYLNVDFEELFIYEVESRGLNNE